MCGCVSAAPSARGCGVIASCPFACTRRLSFSMPRRMPSNRSGLRRARRCSIVLMESALGPALGLFKPKGNTGRASPSAGAPPATMEPASAAVTDPPRAAATVVLLRDGAAGLEVLLLRRHSRSDVLGGVYVFPGGKVDPADAGPAWPARLEDR